MCAAVRLPGIRRDQLPQSVLQVNLHLCRVYERADYREPSLRVVLCCSVLSPTVDP